MGLAVYIIAEKLGKFAWEVKEQMSPTELASWLAFYKIRSAEEKRAQQDADAKARAKAKSGRRQR